MGDQLMWRAYLDIETDADQLMTVLGIFRPDRGARQWVRPDFSKTDVLNFLSGVECLMTYNGARFDLPLVKQQLGLDLERLFNHRDLMWDCWAQNLKGGLKRVEQKLGIHRDTEGIDGLAAIGLWRRYRQGDEEALEILLRYNREDVENLEALARRLGVVAAADDGFQPARLNAPAEALFPTALKVPPTPAKRALSRRQNQEGS